jgi:hypothetical protein
MRDVVETLVLFANIAIVVAVAAVMAAPLSVVSLGGFAAIAWLCYRIFA